MDIVLSRHAQLRAQQWNVSWEEVLFIVEHAHRVHNAGVIFCQLLRRSMPIDLPGNDAYWRLVGTTVLLCSSCRSGVVTLYRAPKAFHEDRKKSKYCLHTAAQCPCCGVLH